MNTALENDKQQKAVVASWDRCQYQYKLTRDAPYPILRLQSAEVAPRLEAMVEQTGGRCGIFRQLAEIAVRMGHCLVLSDADRVLVRLESKNKGHSEFERYGIALGSCWSEQIAGTNGVAMAMAQGEAFTVRGKDHFFKKLVPFTCTAVPLLDARNQMIGAANLATVDRDNLAEYYFARQLLEQAARQIQRILFEQHFRDVLILSIADADVNGLLAKDELIAVDGSGIICGATHKAVHLSNAKDANKLTGQGVEALFGVSIDELLREPGKALSMHFDTGSVVNICVQEAKPVRHTGRNVKPERAKSEQGRDFTRRRLSPSLRELSLGSQVMANILEQAQMCFNKNIPFLIEGESGTGKTELIKALHTATGSSSSQLVSVDCAILEDDQPISTVLEQARLAQALQGVNDTSATLVLEEIGELSNQSQAKLRSLLAAIESDVSAESSQEGAADSSLRVVATTRQDLQAAIHEGLFREDLYYLLCGARFVLPPLRQREGRALLAQALATRLAGMAIELTDESIDVIQNYDWLGNVRELRNALRQSLMAGNGERISLLDLSQFSTLDSGSIHNHPIQGYSTQGYSTQDHPAITRNRPMIKLYDEKTALQDALLGAHWNVTRAAQNLGISRATINRKMKQYGITRPA